MKTRAPRCSFHHAPVIRSGRRRSISRATDTAAWRTPIGSHPGSTRTYRCRPRFPVVFGNATMPTSSRKARTSVAASRTIANVTPGEGSRSRRSSSVSSGAEVRYGQGWNPRHPWLAAHSTWAMSAITIARDVVPLGVDTMVVCSHSGADSGIRFWKNDFPAAPLGKRWSKVGRSRTVRIRGPPDRQVVPGEVGLRLAVLREHDLARVADGDRPPVGVQLQVLGVTGHGRPTLSDGPCPPKRPGSAVGGGQLATSGVANWHVHNSASAGATIGLWRATTLAGVAGDARSRNPPKTCPPEPAPASRARAMR